ncbi:MAG: tripartite tricarboxylate transporter substrate binding protein [Acetobacteraceae bacterium]|nr:tripartite tricarboxylate transporter substrate binding protein [Acetobacteraceae bacterium]
MLRRCLLAFPMLAAPALAQTRAPIRVLVGFAPGGAADQSVRIAADAVARRGGPAIVAETRSGALGFLAMQGAARAAPDGLTLATAIMGNMSVAPAVPGSQVPLDLDRELVPVCNLAGTPMALIVPGAGPDRSVADLVARARAHPGALSYASTGNGSTNQLAAEHFSEQAGGLRLIHVAYRGGAPAVADVAAGRIDLMFANIAEVVELMRGGQVRGLALAAARPVALAPELPLLTRDYPALDMNNWFGLVGPAGLPPDLVQQIGRMFADAMTDPATQPVLDARGLVALPEVGPDFAARIRRDRDRWARVAAAGNIRAD